METKKVLSQYRDIKQVRLNDPDTIIRRNKLGQLWHLSDKVNPGCLEQPLEVDITSSQSRGINPGPAGFSFQYIGSRYG